MAGFAIAGDGAVAHGPRFGILVGLPAAESLAVEHTDPAVLAGGGEGGGQKQNGRENEGLHGCSWSAIVSELRGHATTPRCWQVSRETPRRVADRALSFAMLALPDEARSHPPAWRPRRPGLRRRPRAHDRAQ